MKGFLKKFMKITDLDVDNKNVVLKKDVIITDIFIESKDTKVWGSTSNTQLNIYSVILTIYNNDFVYSYDYNKIPSKISIEFIYSTENFIRTLYLNIIKEEVEREETLSDIEINLENIKRITIYFIYKNKEYKAESKLSAIESLIGYLDSLIY